MRPGQETTEKGKDDKHPLEPPPPSSLGHLWLGPHSLSWIEKGIPDAPGRHTLTRGLNVHSDNRKIFFQMDQCYGTIAFKRADGWQKKRTEVTSVTGERSVVRREGWASVRVYACMEPILMRVLLVGEYTKAEDRIVGGATPQGSRPPDSQLSKG